MTLGELQRYLPQMNEEIDISKCFKQKQQISKFIERDLWKMDQVGQVFPAEISINESERISARISLYQDLIIVNKIDVDNHEAISYKIKNCQCKVLLLNMNNLIFEMEVLDLKIMFYLDMEPEKFLSIYYAIARFSVSLYMKDFITKKGLLGLGSIAKIYMMEFSCDYKPYIQKVLYKKSINTKFLQKQLKNEIRALKAIDIDSVPTFYGVYITKSHILLHQQRIYGDSLRNYHKLFKLDEDLVFEIAWKLLQTIYRIQLLGYIHRDINPDNIFISIGNKMSNNESPKELMTSQNPYGKAGKKSSFGIESDKMKINISSISNSNSIKPKMTLTYSQEIDFSINSNLLQSKKIEVSQGNYIMNSLSDNELSSGQQSSTKDVKILNPNVYQIGFGMAMNSNDKSVAESQQMSKICGKGGYIAPEIIKANTPLKRTKLDQKKVDIFSIGVTIYEILTKNKAFEANSIHDLIKLNHKCEIDFQHQKFQNLNSERQEFQKQLCHPDPDKRISAGDALVHPAMADFDQMENDDKIGDQPRKPQKTACG